MLSWLYPCRSGMNRVVPALNINRITHFFFSISEDDDIFPFMGRIKWCRMHQVLFAFLGTLTGLLSLGFFTSSMLSIISWSQCHNALQEWSLGWIKSLTTQARNCIVNNGSTGHSSLQGYWRFQGGHTFPSHRWFPHCMRAFLTHEARECLHILRHLCFGILYVTPEGLNNVMVIGTHTGAQDGPPTTMLAITGTLMGAATGAAMRCVSCSLLVTEGGKRALLTMACTFSLPLPPLLAFF